MRDVSRFVRIDRLPMENGFERTILPVRQIVEGVPVLVDNFLGVVVLSLRQSILSIGHPVGGPKLAPLDHVLAHVVQSQSDEDADGCDAAAQERSRWGQQSELVGGGRGNRGRTSRQVEQLVSKERRSGSEHRQEGCEVAGLTKGVSVLRGVLRLEDCKVAWAPMSQSQSVGRAPKGRRTLGSDSTTERKGWVLISLLFGQLDREDDTYFPAAHAMKVRVVVTDFLL